MYLLTEDRKFVFLREAGQGGRQARLQELELALGQMVAGHRRVSGLLDVLPADRAVRLQDGLRQA